MVRTSSSYGLRGEDEGRWVQSALELFGKVELDHQANLSLSFPFLLLLFLALVPFP